MLKTDFLNQMDRLEKHFKTDDYEIECDNFWERFKNTNLAIFRQAVDWVIDNRKIKYFPRIADIIEGFKKGQYYSENYADKHLENCDCEICKMIYRIEHDECMYCKSNNLHPKDVSMCILCHVRSKYYYCLCEYCEKARKILKEREQKEKIIEIEEYPF